MRAAIILAAISTLGVTSAFETFDGPAAGVNLVQREADAKFGPVVHHHATHDHIHSEKREADAEPIIPLLIKGAKIGIKAGIKGGKAASRANNANNARKNRKNKREADPRRAISPKAMRQALESSQRVLSAHSSKNKREAEAEADAEPIIPLLIKGAKIGIKAGIKGGKAASRANNANNARKNRKNKREAEAEAEAEADPRKAIVGSQRLHAMTQRLFRTKSRREAEADPANSVAASLARLHGNFRNSRLRGTRRVTRREAYPARRRPTGGSGNGLKKMKELAEKIKNLRPRPSA